MARGWSERAADRAASTHGGRIAICVGLLLLGVGGTLLLVLDTDALSGPRGFGFALAPVLVGLALYWLVRELRTGDSRARGRARGR